MIDYHIVALKDRERIRCNDTMCDAPAVICKHSHWDTGNTKGVSFYYLCLDHTDAPAEVLAGV